MPLPLALSCFSEIQIGFTFLVPAHRGSPGQRAVKRVCVCVCVCVCDGVVQCVGVSDSSPSPCVAALRAVRSVRHPRHTAHTQPTSAQVNRRPVCCYDVIAALGQSCRQLDDSPNTNTHTHNRLTVLCPGLPGRAGTRRIIHPLAPILFIRHQAGMSPLPGGR